MKGVNKNKMYGMDCTMNMAQNNNYTHLRLEVIDPWNVVLADNE